MHPEHPHRLEAVLAALEAPEFSEVRRREAPRASLEQLQGVHPHAYVEAILAAVPDSGQVALDPDTLLTPGSGEAALHAAGAVCAAVDAVLAEEADNAFCAVRPPGHHAEPHRAMGFCLFNNIAVGALHARQAHRLHRIAVVDFDVHHGNGTQEAFWDDPDLFYASTHQMPLYPGTGAASERGVGQNILNLPLPPGAGSEEFRTAVSQQIMPNLVKFDPDFLFISAGFDGHARDPLAGLSLSEADFHWATRELVRFAEHACRGRVVSVLEGGYDPDALGLSAAAHVRAMMGRDQIA